MANSDQIKALIKSHTDGDDKRFYAVVMQVVASAAKSGHHKLASELKDLLEDLKKNSKAGSKSDNLYRITPKNTKELNLFSIKDSEVRLKDMVLSHSVSEKFNRILLEQKQSYKLKDYGLNPKRKILLIGPPGCGKTMLANAFAGELHTPLYTVLFETLITRYMGETATKLRSVFNTINHHKGVFFFDEFDAIGGQRSARNDVGEMRRVLNSFLQLLEEDYSDNLVIAATNHPELLDKALFRRFDEVIEFDLPDSNLTMKLIENYFRNLKLNKVDWDSVLRESQGLSYAEISKALVETLKELILFDLREVTTDTIVKNLKNRYSFNTK